MNLNLKALNTAYATYKEDPDRSHDLFSLCLAETKRIVNRRIWGNDLQYDRENIAQDIVMDVFVSLPTIKPDRIFAFWFLKVVRNNLNAAITQRYDRDEVSLAWDIAGETEWESSYNRLREAAGANGELIDALIQDYDLDAAAGTLGISTGAVKQRLQRIKAKAGKLVA